ncbi:ArnT family glycosyltransferase [Dictyobacter aurantiacus]|uniref:Glycosyltransferase RgtA/B/C/D-like domain-containing protein n=1 Tax=Dictyobacter aurantiacus TaxID=1936993 RepID=A0A401Z918_9CHLR|nr:hypothetical protein [Dictyobacter aurantiacus]GCE03329.1 hypothetical protein KDAU_06580 [Dictyobacter aurantiacus]
MLNVRLLNRKLNAYSLIAAAIIAFALGLRLILILLHWPATNSDEGIMAIIANDIAYHGKWPLMFYGQDYMGVIEAYLGALFYHLTGGLSITALRLGVVLLIGLFFIVMYRLTSLIYSQKMALLTLAILCFSTLSYVGRLVLATGGSAETILFGSLSFLIAARLAYTYERQATTRTRLLRLPGYLLFGIVVGLGIWSDMVGLALYLMATLLLIIFCWREIFIWGGWLIGLIGGTIGLLPTIIYSIQIGSSPIADLLGKAESPPLTATPEQLTLWHKVVETFQVSLPTATSSPFCPVIEYPFMGDNTPRTLNCGIIQSSWSIGYVLLLIASIAITILALKYLRKNQEGLSPREQHQQRVRYVTRLCMLGSAILSLLIYINSAGPVNQPGYHARYIISLVVITPAILGPLYEAASHLRPELKWARVRFYGGRAVLAALAVTFIAGTYIAFTEVPKAQAASNRREHLIKQLNALHVSYLYTDYWTCYSLVVATMNTKHPIICAVVDDQLSNKHNRIKDYEAMVKKSTRPPFMCATDLSLTTKETYNCVPAAEKLARDTNRKIGHYFVIHKLDGYLLFRAEPKS